MSAAVISVVMGTFNGDRFIREQLESILAQTLMPSEILVSDDGSSDQTLAVVADVARTSPIPIRVHVNPVNLGFAENFLAAAARATGTHVAFSDQDDRWHPDKLEVGWRALVEHDALLSSHAVGKIDAAGRPLPPGAGVDGDPAGVTLVEQGDADPWGNYYGFTLLFDRALLDRFPAAARGDDPHEHGAPLAHDRWLWFLASTFGRIVRVNAVLAEYRQHDQQLYGHEAHRSVAERVAHKLRAGGEETRARAAVCAARAELLESYTGDDSESARAAARQWRRRSVQLTRSAEIYTDASLPVRLRMLGRGICAGAYGPYDTGGLGRRRLRHDAVIAATPRRISRRVS